MTSAVLETFGRHGFSIKMEPGPDMSAVWKAVEGDQQLFRQAVSVILDDCPRLLESLETAAAACGRSRREAGGAHLGELIADVWNDDRRRSELTNCKRLAASKAIKPRSCWPTSGKSATSSKHILHGS